MKLTANLKHLYVANAGLITGAVAIGAALVCLHLIEYCMAKIYSRKAEDCYPVMVMVIYPLLAVNAILGGALMPAKKLRMPWVFLVAMAYATLFIVPLAVSLALKFGQSLLHGWIRPAEIRMFDVLAYGGVVFAAYALMWTLYHGYWHVKELAVKDAQPLI